MSKVFYTKTYEIIIPEEPPVGTLVRFGDDGLVYKRINNLWFPHPNYGGAGTVWEVLLRRGPLTDITPLRTFAMPEEPPIGTKVRDREGDVWTRGESGWGIDYGRLDWAYVPSYGPLTWAHVLSYGPLTEVR